MTSANATVLDRIASAIEVSGRTLTIRSVSNDLPSLTLELPLAEDAARSAISGFLYANYYAFDPTLAQLQATDYFVLAGARISANDLRVDLAEANPGHGYFAGGWRIVERPNDSQRRVERNGVTIVVDVNKHLRPEHHNARIGDSVDVRFPKDSFEGSTGFYLAFSDAGPAQREDQVRIYLHLRAEHAVAVTGALLRRLQPLALAFTFKVLAHRNRYRRRDTAVLYVERADLAQALAQVVAVHDDFAEAFVSTIPSFTHRICPGIAIAENPPRTSPGVDVSFGEHRCGVIAEAIINVVAKDSAPGQTVFCAAINAAFEAAGLDVDRLYLNSATSAELPIELDSTPKDVPVVTRLSPQRPVALVSMPWFFAALPSIQLATLQAHLRKDNIACETYSLYLDYAARIGLVLYNILSNAGGFVEEWIFARHYFAHETGADLSEFRESRPRFGLDSVEIEEKTLDALIAVTDDFLEETAAAAIWNDHDIVGFSISVAQTAPSMALARLLKLRYPHIKIIFGGSACAGPMGPAMMRVCPYVDVVVSVEGELVISQVIRALRGEAPFPKSSGVHRRGVDGITLDTPVSSLVTHRDPLLEPEFDEYFARLRATGLANRVNVWLPFEGSRGCWWGEKQHCTFCGLHEIMKFRSWSPATTLATLERYAAKYDVNQFFAVDLIMPREYSKEFLPELARKHRNWFIFYEIKANMKRAEIELMAEAGVRWVQPGIESLHDASLELMNKGVTAAQNVALLKWCQEFGILVTWNIIAGMPGERAEAYDEMACIMPHLHHFAPPSGVSRFALHRFSPYFEHPEKYGITRRGAHPLYRYIFPVPDEDRDDLTYLHSYTLNTPNGASKRTDRLVSVVERWRTARARSAKLEMTVCPNGSVEILDTRELPEKRHLLQPVEFVLYQYLDAPKLQSDVVAGFAAAHALEAEALERGRGVLPLIESWCDLGLVLRCSGRFLALATRTVRAQPFFGDRNPLGS